MLYIFFSKNVDKFKSFNSLYVFKSEEEKEEFIKQLKLNINN